MRLLVLAAGLGLASVSIQAAALPDAKALFAAKCSKCHGPDGTAPLLYAKKGAPDLKDPEWQKTMTDAEIAKAISDGSEGTLMRAFKAELSPGDIQALVRFVRKLGGR